MKPNRRNPSAKHGSSPADGAGTGRHPDGRLSRWARRACGCPARRTVGCGRQRSQVKGDSDHGRTWGETAPVHPTQDRRGFQPLMSGRHEGFCFSPDFRRCHLKLGP